MKIATVSQLRLEQKNNLSIVSADFRVGNRNFHLWYREKNLSIETAPDAFLAATLLPAMKAANVLNIRGEVSPLLLASAEVIQDIFSKWYPEFQKITIKAKARKAETTKKKRKGAACFFTGGVDSFYTLLKHRAEISKVVYVHGFDVWLHETAFRFMMSDHLQTAASSLNQELYR